MKELDAVKTKLYTNITQEFRTPLTVILGMAGQVMDNPDEHLRKGLKMIMRNGQNLLTLVNQMLDLNKLESGKLSLQYHHADVISFLGYIVDSFHSLAESKGVQVHFISVAEQLNMDFDEVRLQQVVSNIIYNAIKFTPKGGHVYVSTDTKNDSFILKIKDTGIGIAEADLPYIFDRFYQADDSQTRHGEGTGIGLALTHELVKLMKGTIAVKSKMGNGAEFEVVLPLRFFSDPETTIKVPLVSMDKHTNHEYAVPIDEASLPALITPSDNENGNAHVLIADDNEDVLAFVASCLENEFAVDIAKNGQDCEELAFGFEKQGFAIVTDFSSLEKFSGLEIMGVIGNSIFKNCEVVLDYIFKELTVYQLDKKGNRLSSKNIHQTPLDTLSFTIVNGVPFVEVFANGMRLKMSVDSGATANVMDIQEIDRLNSGLMQVSDQSMASFGPKEVSVKSQMIENLNVGHLTCPPMKTLFVNLGHFNKSLNGIKVSGILGYEFLSNFRVAFNFKKKVIYLWNRETVELQWAIASRNMGKQ